jgi:hypothetical protein
MAERKNAAAPAGERKEQPANRPGRNARGRGRGGQRRNASTTRGQAPNVPAYLLISKEFADYKNAGAAVDTLARPLGLSVSAVGKAIAAYSALGEAEKNRLHLNAELVRAYAVYQRALQAWEHLRDSFRAHADALAIDADLLDEMVAEEADAGDAGNGQQAQPRLNAAQPPAEAPHQ